jgi:hypothetical protein
MHGSLSTSPNRSTGTLGATGDSTLGVLSAKATTVESLTDTGDASVGGKLTVTGKGGMLAARSRLLKRDKQKHGDGFIWPI